VAIFPKDGTPYNEKEIELIKSLTGVKQTQKVK